MPWNRPQDRDETAHEAYRTLFALRRAEPALRHGGLRWLHADTDCLVFLRETAEESLLVCARRAPGEPLALLFETRATGLYNATDLDDPVIPGDGPGLRVWRLALPS